MHDKNLQCEIFLIKLQISNKMYQYQLGITNQVLKKISKVQRLIVIILLYSKKILYNKTNKQSQNIVCSLSNYTNTQLPSIRKINFVAQQTTWIDKAGGESKISQNIEIIYENDIELTNKFKIKLQLTRLTGNFFCFFHLKLKIPL